MSLPIESAAFASPADLLAGLVALCGNDGRSRCTALVDVSIHGSAGCASSLGMDETEFAGLPNLYDSFSATFRLKGPRMFAAQFSDRRWLAICELALSLGSASFIIHDSHVNILKEHLKSLIRLAQPDGSKRLFRFQDTIVLSTLVPLLTGPQRRALLGPARIWLVLGVCGNPVRVEQDINLRARTSSLMLTKQQISDLDVGLRPGTIIAQANDTDGALLQGLSKCEQWRAVQRAMGRAANHGLSSREDVALYCVLSLQLPVSFDSAGPIADALQHRRQEGLSFGEAIDQIPIKEWRAWDEKLDTMEDAR